MAKKEFKVAGVTYSNGMLKKSRQEVIKGCSHGDSVKLEHDYSNNYDDYAVKVLTQKGEQIGYIPKGSNKSKRVFLSLEKKDNVTAHISEKFSFVGDENYRIYGLRVKVNNLLSSKEAKETEEEGGCIGVFVVLMILFFIAWWIF